MSVHIGIDVGGTFTDIVVLRLGSGQLDLFKVPSTRPATAGVIQGLKRAMQALRLKPEQITRLVHGSTVATNAILEGKWAKTALLTTEGFRDVLEIGRQNRLSLYDLSVDRPESLVPRAQRFGIGERLDYRGDVIKALNSEHIEALIPRLQETESIAVCYLFSYLNPAHEEQTRAILAKSLALPITLSSDILPEYREYERTATTVMCAALRPVVGRYLEDLDQRVRDLDLKVRLQVMLSNAGIVSASRAAQHAVQMLFSGPAGGVEGSRFIGEQAGLKDLITFDMGGTSTDVSLIQQNRIVMKTEGVIEGRPVRMPMVDIHSIGAGGGSLAWTDAGRALRVGPQSAAADPGPACYGKGERPTVTDAQLALGRLGEQSLLGSQRLDRERAERAIYDHIAQPLGLSLANAAAGILEIADAQMNRAIRLISVERGHDPRKFALLAFGGAGPMHACTLAQRLSMPKIIVPPVAGVLSALGLLVADYVQDFVQTFIQNIEQVNLQKLRAYYEKMKAEAEARLRHEPLSAIEFSYTLDMRYRGQSYELPIEIAATSPTPETIMKSVECFHAAHARLYGYAMLDRPVEMVNLRLRAIGRMPKSALKLTGSDSRIPERADTVRNVFFRELGWMSTSILVREGLKAGMKLHGPAVIEGRESTIVLWPNQTARVDSFGNVIIESEEAR
jgi:N-methylhydantoinase A